jgi:hypothetical protein
VQQWTSLGGLLRYGWFFSAFLVILPLLAIENAPLHGLLGGLFVDLTKWEIYFVTMSFLGLAWCLMLAEGLIVNGIESWWSGGSAYRHLHAGTPTGYVPPWAETFFSVHITGPQFTFFSLLALPGIIVMVRYSVAGSIAGVVAAGLGAVTAYVLLMLLSSPAAILDDANHPMVRLPLSKTIRVLWGSIPPGSRTRCMRSTARRYRSAPSIPTATRGSPSAPSSRASRRLSASSTP